MQIGEYFTPSPEIPEQQMSSLVDFNGRQIDPRAQLLDLDRTEAEESLYVFLKQAWKYVDPAPFTEGWHIQAIAEHLQAVCDGEI